jgi:hypothetical protein
MFTAERHEPLLPFPRVPENVKGRYSISDLALRPFGLYESDLNLDFSHTARPFLVTRILESCTRDAQGGAVEQKFFWNLTVGKRIECLLSLAAFGEHSEIPITFLCPNQACGQESETELSLAEISAFQQQAYEAERVAIQFQDELLALRRPTGSDQLGWLGARFESEAAAAREMFRTLRLPAAEDAVIDDSIPGELLQAVDEAMEEHDPLINFNLRVQCPYCEVESPNEIDLEAVSLRWLRHAQLRLLASVHCLAAHYHWSEQQVFSVPYWRRAYYLGLIEKEKNQ